MTFIIRPARESDVGDLVTLATSLSARGFLTLPTGKEAMEDLIDLSQRSFRGLLSDVHQGEYLFSLENLEEEKVIGSSLIVARHGTPESPHIYFEVAEVQKASPSLKKVLKHKVLRLRLDAEGRTELGGLILDPAYRRHPARLGKNLSYARFAYIRDHPDRFLDRLLVELLPPLTDEGKSLFWESLGRKLTGLGYQEADRLSRKDKEFITSLFPEGDFYCTLLPQEAQELIGQVGPETRPVARMLEELGFKFLNQIDPFDGGPHYGALQRDVRIGLVEDFLEKSSVKILWE